MPPPDPNQGGVQGLLGNLFPGNNAAALYQGLLSDPATQQQFNQRALQAMAGSFAQSAMPTRMPTPFGAVLGNAAAAVGPAQDAVMQARLQEAQGEQERAVAALTTQKVGVLGGMGADQAAYDQAMANSITPTVPGTLGAPTVATVSHNVGPGWMPGFGIPPNSTGTATMDPKLNGSENLTNLANAAVKIALPGYTIVKTSGYRPDAEVAGGGGQSQHAKDNAADFQLYTPDGKPIPKEGPDTTGAYSKLALTMYRIASPDIKPWLGWGGNFSTGVTGPADLMHFDFAGDRGHRGTLAQMEQQWLAANQPQGQNPAPPGLLGPGAVPPPAAGPGPGAPGAPAPPAGGPPPGPPPSVPPPAAQPGPGAGPPPPGPGAVSPQFLAALKASGRTDAEIAQIVATMSGPQPQPPPGPGATAPPPPGPAPQGPPPGPPGLLNQGPIPPDVFATGAPVRGSWYGNSPGWSDPSDRGNQANGQPVSAGPGIALPIPKSSPDFGKLYNVTFPNGRTLQLAQTDIGPDAKGRGVDVNSVAAAQAGYTPKTFPTDQPIMVQPAPGQAPPAGGAPPGLLNAQAAPPQQPFGVPPPSNIPGAPNAAAIAAAKKLERDYIMMQLPVPSNVSAVANWDIKGAEAARDAAIKYYGTAQRPGAATPLPGGGYVTAPYAPTPTTVYNPQTERPEAATMTPQPGGAPPIVATGGFPSAPSEREKATGQALGPYTQSGVPGMPTAPPGTFPQGTVDPTKSIPSPGNAGRNFQTNLPAINLQPPIDLSSYGKAQTDWLKTSAEMADAGVKAQTAEANLMAIAKAYQMVETGTWQSEKAEFDGILKTLNLPTVNNANDLAQLQIALHNNYKETLQNLKAVNSRFTGNEFKINSDAGVSAGNQPAANFALLTQDLGQLRQLRALAEDWGHAQTVVGSNGAHWVNPDAFKTFWTQENKLQPMIDQARKDVGPFRGMPGWQPPAGSGLLPQQQPPAAPPSPSPGARVPPPSGVPAGSTPTSRTSGGKPVWLAPDGTFHTGN